MPARNLTVMPEPKGKPAGQASRVVLYARVSSKEQREQGYSIEAQVRLLRDYAVKQGFVIVEEFIDVESASITIGGFAFTINYNANSVVLTSATTAQSTVYVDDSWVGTAPGVMLSQVNELLASVWTASGLSTRMTRRVASGGSIKVWDGKSRLAQSPKIFFAAANASSAITSPTMARMALFGAKKRWW